MEYKNKNSLDRGENWDQQAACAELMRGDPVTFDEYFYPDAPDRAVTRMAKRICQACPVRVECLEDALGYADDYGLKGGLTAQERRQHRKLRRIPTQRGDSDAV